MPFRNAAATLRPAIESIRSQTFKNWELLLFDDGSDDESPAIADACATGDARIRVIRSTYVGIVSALQKACATARAPLIARMDADDVAHPSRFEKQAARMQADGSIALCGCHIQWIGPTPGAGQRRYASWINALENHDDIVRELFVECPIAHPTFMMRRDQLEHVGGYIDRGWPEDYDLVMRLWMAGCRFGKVPEVLLDWRIADTRLSMTDPRYALSRFRALKRHYLRRAYWGRNVGAEWGKRFFQWGAGEVGKLWLREWESERPEAVVDINPRKIGRRIHGVPVISPDLLPAPREVFVAVTVGAPGARDEIRGWLNPRGYAETVDYLFLA
ncbi:MAG: hypothetical protein AMXMBFR4_16280 [Candidatus Hydrogenedentota bacterium]